MKSLLWFTLLACVLLVCAPAVHAQVAAPATLGEWYTMLDNAYFFNRVVPDGLLSGSGTVAFQHAEALGLVCCGNDPAQALTYDIVNNNISQLFMGGNGMWWGDTKQWLKDRYRIDIDSAECALRGIPLTFMNGEDTVSFGVLNYFGTRAEETPIFLVLPGQGVMDGPTVIPLEIWRNAIPLAGFSTHLSSSAFWDATFDTVIAYNGFSVVNAKVNNVYNLGGIRASGGGVDSFHLQVASLQLHGLTLGRNDIIQTEAIVADTAGTRDVFAWPLRSFLLIYDRFDVNQNFTVTLSDAVMCSRLVLRGIPAAIPGLGDVNFNNVLDADDPLIILGKVINPGKTAFVRPLSVTDGDATHGVLKINVKNAGNTVTLTGVFEGNLGGSRRFGGTLAFDTTRMRFSELRFLQSSVDAITGYVVAGNILRILDYPQPIRPGVLFEAKFARLAEGNNQFSFVPLVQNFFSFGENVRVIFEGDNIELGKDIPLTFALDQNYPNPFNPVTTILYTISEPAFVTLKVFTVLGVEVKTLVSESKGRGLHAEVFDGAGLSSGNYFYELRAGNQRVLKRMMLVK